MPLDGFFFGASILFSNQFHKIHRLHYHMNQAVDVFPLTYRLSRASLDGKMVPALANMTQYNEHGNHLLHL